MTEEAQPSVEPEEAASDPTQDDVIIEFNIETPIQAQPPAEQPAEQQYAPQTQYDPYDPDSVKQVMEQRYTTQQQTIEELKQSVQRMQEQEGKARIDADIKQAVGTLTANVKGLNPNMAEAFLEMKARTDQTFNTIWENRRSNPQAFEKAMGIISNEAKDTFAVKDDQLVENQRAMNQSIQTNTNQAPAVNSVEDRLNQADSLADRDRIRQEIMRGG